MTCFITKEADLSWKAIAYTYGTVCRSYNHSNNGRRNLVIEGRDKAGETHIKVRAKQGAMSWNSWLRNELLKAGIMTQEAKQPKRTVSNESKNQIAAVLAPTQPYQP
jgi:hypothetical protein